MADTNTREIGGLTLPEINHIGVVVRNLDEAMRRFERSLGIGPFHSYEREFADSRVRGEIAPCKLGIAFGNLQTILFELIEPREGQSIHQEFLDQHGEGLQHLGFLVPDLAADLSKLEANGLRVLMEATVPGRGGIAYIEGEAAAGVLFELIQDGPATREFQQRLWDATRR